MAQAMFRGTNQYRQGFGIPRKRFEVTGRLPRP